MQEILIAPNDIARVKKFLNNNLFTFEVGNSTNPKYRGWSMIRLDDVDLFEFNEIVKDLKRNNVKLTTKVNEMTLKNTKYLLENEISYTKEERKAFLESLRAYHTYKPMIFREKSMREICSEIAKVLENVEVFTLEETKDWFDEQSVNRDLKELKTDFALFEKTCKEVTILQQRLESLYENMGTKLGKYYEI